MRNFGMSNRPASSGAQRIQAGPRYSANSTRADLNFSDDEQNIAAWKFALGCFASPFVIVGLIVLGFMTFAPLIGLPSVPAF